MRKEQGEGQVKNRLDYYSRLYEDSLGLAILPEPVNLPASFWKSPDPVIRHIAAGVLAGHFSNFSNAAKVIACLSKDPDKDVCMSALRTVGRNLDRVPDGAQLLKAALESQEPEVRTCLAGIINFEYEKLPQAGDWLNRLAADNEPSVVKVALESIGLHLRDLEKPPEQVEEYVSHSSAEVRWAAGGIIYQALALADQEGKQEILERFGNHLTKEVMLCLLGAVYSFFDSVPPDKVDVLLCQGALSPHREVRLEVLNIIGKKYYGLGDPLRDLSLFLEDEDLEVRGKAKEMYELLTQPFNRPHPSVARSRIFAEDSWKNKTLKTQNI